MSGDRPTPRRAVAAHRVDVYGTNCWIYVPAEEAEKPEEGETALRGSAEARKPCFLIDPGACPDEITRKLENLNLYPTHILLTHGHFDHIGALPDVAAHYGAQGVRAAVAIHQADALYLGNDSRDAHRLCWSVAVGSAEYIETHWKPQPDPTILLQDGDRIGHLRALHVPGHTPGSVAFFDEEARLLFSGDCLFKNAVGRIDLPGGDADRMRDSLRRLFALGDDVAVYPGHGEATVIGAERRFYGGSFPQDI